MRIRKNAALVTKDVRDRYIAAVKSLKGSTVRTSQGEIIGRYDHFVALHLGVIGRIQGNNDIGDGAHGESAFLPWHRQYLLDYEAALRSDQKFSTLDLLYWDWADVESTKNIIFHDDFMGSEGSKVDGTEGYGPVKSGHFSEKKDWKIIDDLHRSHIRDEEGKVPKAQGIELLRNTRFDYSSNPRRGLPSRKQQDDFVKDPRFGTYDAFRGALESDPHGRLHVWIGGFENRKSRGTMSGMSSPNDPVFFMHHTTVDWIWARWQDNGHQGSSHYSKKPHDAEPLRACT